jgi:hypothetical protein
MDICVVNADKKAKCRIVTTNKPSTDKVQNTRKYKKKIPVGGSGGGRRTIFSAPVLNPPSPYKMGTGSFPGVKRPTRRVNHPLPSSSEVKERVELYLYISEP